MILKRVVPARVPTHIFYASIKTFVVVSFYIKPLSIVQCTSFCQKFDWFIKWNMFTSCFH